MLNSELLKLINGLCLFCERVAPTLKKCLSNLLHDIEPMSDTAWMTENQKLNVPVGQNKTKHYWCEREKKKGIVGKTIPYDILLHL